MSEQANIATDNADRVAGAFELLAWCAGDLEGPSDDFAWLYAIAKPGSATRLAMARDLRTLLADHARLEKENARLREDVKALGGMSNTCVYYSLQEVCDYCRCPRALTNREGQDNE